MHSLELLKIQITNEPFTDVNGVWHYDLVAVFDKVVAIMRGGVDPQWKILKNNYLAPSTFVDAIMYNQVIYAVIEPQGDVLVWDPLEWG